VSNGKEISAQDHRDVVEASDSSPNNQYRIVIHKDTVQVLKVNSNEEIARIVHERGVNAAALSRDGKFIATAGADGTARVWLWRPEDLVHEACARLTRNLTHQEWDLNMDKERYRRTCPNLPEGP
jgi:WD40 repeat protein